MFLQRLKIYLLYAKLIICKIFIKIDIHLKKKYIFLLSFLVSKVLKISLMLQVLLLNVMFIELSKRKLNKIWVQFCFTNSFGKYNFFL